MARSAAVMRHGPRRLWRCRCGNATVEFALILLPMLLVICGGIELSMLSYTRTQLEGAVTQATRMATTGHYTDKDINAFIKARMVQLRIGEDDVQVKRLSYRSFSDIGKPEPLVSDVEPLGGAPSKGDCYQDVNGNGVWDADMGSDTLGLSEDIIRYTVTARYTMLFSFLAPAFMAKDNKIDLNANAVMKSEPWGDSSSALKPIVELCIS